MRHAIGRCACRERAQRIVAGKIASSADDLLALERSGAVANHDPGSDALGVGWSAPQADGEAGRDGIVPIETDRLVDRRHDHVEIAVVVEVGQGHGLGHAHGVESPCGAALFEGEVVLVPVGEVRRGQSREAEVSGKSAFHRRGPALAQVGVVGVPQVTGGDQDVLVAVEIDIEKRDAPGPLRGFDSGELGDLGIGAVAAVQEEHVAGVFGAIERDRRMGEIHLEMDLAAALAMALLVFAAEHVGHQQVIVARRG